MSRSWRTHAAGEFWGGRKRSEKADKKAWHRRFRTKAKLAAVALRRVWSPEADWDAAFAGVHFRAVSNPWDMIKDGKTWWGRRIIHDFRRRRRDLCWAHPEPRSTWTGVVDPETPRDLHKLLGK